MEFEQIIKRLEWLDEEHRKDKTDLNALKGQVTSLEGTLDTLTKQIKNLDKKLSDIGPATARINQFDEVLSKQRDDMNKALTDLEKKHQRRERDRIKRHQSELEDLNQSIEKIASAIPNLEKKLKGIADEDIRSKVVLSELKQAIEEVSQKNDEVSQAHKLIEGSAQRESKRVADMQGDITALRKRVDELHQKSELQGDSHRILENRFSEFIESDTKRNQKYEDFLQKQNLEQVERDRAYKEWQEKFDNFKQQIETLESQTQTLDETLRAAKQAQETYLDLNQKLERRINEITEMQRLAEDRLRQEWVTFKSDDQKRWTGYTLSADESMRDLRKSMDKMEERLTTIDDTTQTMQDQLHQTTDTTEQQLQELMNLSHEWLTAYERIMGHARKSPK